MPDVDAEKASLEPESVAFMETLIAREHGQGGLQNGFSPTSCGGDALSGGGTVIKTRAEDEEKLSTPPEQICPVGLHKAVLLYPFSTQQRSLSPFCCFTLSYVSYISNKLNIAVKWHNCKHFGVL